MELVKMYRNRAITLHYEGCLLNKWGLIVMVVYDEDSDEEKVRQTVPDKQWHTDFFNNEYYFM